jgi:hypothetical protein
MNFSIRSTSAIRLLHEALFSLNLGFAISFGLLTYSDLASNPHRVPFDPLVSSINNWFYSHARTTGLGPAFVGEAFSIAIIVFLPLVVLRFAPAAFGRAVLGPFACMLALSAAPIFWELAVSYSGPYIHRWDITPAWWTLVCETMLTMAALYFALSKRKPIAYSFALLFAHCGFWAYYMWPALSQPFFFTPRIVAVASAAAGVSWVVYAKANLTKRTRIA